VLVLLQTISDSSTQKAKNRIGEKSNVCDELAEIKKEKVIATGTKRQAPLKKQKTTTVAASSLGID
jgi:hypothetical protein